MQLIVIGLLLGLILTLIFEKISLSNKELKKLWDNPKTIKGFHIHHSVPGLIIFLFGTYLFLINIEKGLFLIGFGIGIIIVHTITDGRFIFIERN